MTAPSGAGRRRSPVDLGRLRPLLSTDPLDVVPRLTPLLVLPTAQGPALVGLAVAYAVVIVSPRLYRHPLTWFALAAVHLVPLLGRWEGVDNHEWLIGYWVLAIGLAFLARDPAAVLARQGSLLVALVFGFAVVWKVISGQYLDGDFFTHALLADPRFEPVTTTVLRLPDDAYAANQAALARMATDAEPVTLASSGAVRPAALAMTWWGLVLEALLAVAYLVRHPRAVRLRLPLLALFVVSTYAVVPVVTFGLVLALMTYAGLTTDRQRRACLALIAFLVVWSPVWRLVTGVSA